MRKQYLRRWPLVLTAFLTLACCGEDAPSGVTGPSETTTIAIFTGTWLRVANLSSDLNGSKIRIDGKVLRERLSYPDVTSYRRVEPGSHRIVFVPPPKPRIDPRTVDLETIFDIGPEDAVTIIASGLVVTRTLRVTAIQDDLTPSGNGRGYASSTRCQTFRRLSAFGKIAAPL